MAKTVVGLFDEAREAQQAVDDLQNSGFARDAIMVVKDANDAQSPALINGLGLPTQDVQFYSEGVRQGGTLVIVRTADTDAARAAAILAKYNMVDMDARMAQYRQAGNHEMNLSTLDANGTVIPVVEEELQVGKRQVQRGGVRIHTVVTETPVEESVRLRDETVHVERHAVNRPVTDADMAAMREGTLEVTETDEEAVVAKAARVVEEVVVGKQATERTETVRDSVRRTQVDVEQLSGAQTTGTTAVDNDDSYFRTYYTTHLAQSGATYEQYQPVFHYGTSLASDKRYSGKDWAQVEAGARTDWEAQHPGTWEQFKDSVQYAWERARGKR